MPFYNATHRLQKRDSVNTLLELICIMYSVQGQDHVLPTNQYSLITATK